MRIRALGPGPIIAMALTALAAVLAPAFASAAPTFAPADQATVHPGVATDTEGAQCTSNFIFTNGSDVFVGMVAHCAGTGAATALNGCDAPSRPLGTPVAVGGASQPGTLVYSSWLAMQQRDEQDANACIGNDFALVELDPSDVASTNPSVPFGGPAGLDADGPMPGEPVYSYGSSPLRGGLLSAKSGIATGTINGGWTHEVLTITPGVPGDSGSGFLSADGSAFGVLTTLALAPVPGSNGVTDLALALEYANAHGRLGTVTLVDGTEPFRAPLVPLGL